MKYELAKQLKEAGFPYKIYTCCDNTDTEHECRADKSDCILKTLNSHTLSELIEACGEKFGFLSKVQGENSFIAQVPGGIVQFKDKSSTPEEAVAKLWLELNKK